MVAVVLLQRPSACTLGAMSAISLASSPFSHFLFVNGNNAFMGGVDAANQHVLFYSYGHMGIKF